jgi:2,5-diketo-D-gluconate reductase B
MKYETLRDIRIPKIGFGTGRVGGTLLPLRGRDAYYSSVLRSAFDLGYTHIDTAEMYALGHAEELVGGLLHEAGVKRQNLFLTSKVSPTNLGYPRLLRACENSLRRLGVDLIDLYLIHWPNPFTPLKESFRALNQLVKAGKVRHLGVSNFNLERLKEAEALSETPIITDQVPYSLFNRSYARNGVLEHCRENDILLTAYTPVSHGQISASRTIQSIAHAHAATPSQIALARLVAQPRVITIPMSFNPEHQKGNLAAADIDLSKMELAQLEGLG